LTVRQVEVLRWIGDDCPDGVWRDFTYKTIAYALAARGLVTVDRRRKRWAATLTDEGRFYLAHGQYPSGPRSVGTRSTSEIGSETDTLAEELLAELTSGDGLVTVASPSQGQRARYRRAIHRLIAEHRVPEGFVLRHTGRDHGDLTIRLVGQDDERNKEPPPKIPVSQSNSITSDEVRALANRVRIAVTDSARERALRILQAITDECTTRTWTLGHDPRDDRRFQIRTQEGPFDFTLREELVDRDMPDEDRLTATKYPWQRVPLHVRKVGSGRLTLQLGQYYRTRSWSDRSRWTLEDKLGALFAELETRVAEAAEERHRREDELLRHQQAWDAAALAAQRAYVVDLNRRRLIDQVTRRRQARQVREYADSLEELTGSTGDVATAESIRGWQQFARAQADRIDPLQHVDQLAYLDPASVGPDEFAAFMPEGFNVHHRPT
jgi:hypothetical protein